MKHDITITRRVGKNGGVPTRSYEYDIRGRHPSRGGFLSEFYDSRRTVITDVGALSGFAVGALVASAFAWRLLATGFRTGELERALFFFLGIVLGSGFAGGALGLWSGRAAGRVWEGRHKRHRVDVHEPDDMHRSATPPDSTAQEQPQDVALGLTFRAFGVEVDQFLILLRRARPDEPHEIRTASNLGRTWNIGAFDGARLAGAVRILSDGRFSHVAELLVDPEYAARGLESALRDRADAWMRTNGLG